MRTLVIDGKQHSIRCWDKKCGDCGRRHWLGGGWQCGLFGNRSLTLTPDYDVRHAPRLPECLAAEGAVVERIEDWGDGYTVKWVCDDLAVPHERRRYRVTLLHDGQHVIEWPHLRRPVAESAIPPIIAEHRQIRKMREIAK